MENILGTLAGFKNIESYAPNQFVMTFENWKVFQSYNSVIAICTDGKIYLGNDWDYSRTTGKYRNMFLWEDKKETEKKIESWEYTLLNI